MTTYKGIKGFSIQTVAGDPGTIVDGLIWYDSIARKVQGSKTGAGTWASGGNLNTAKGSTGAATDGANTTGLVFGGLSATATLAETESYNGSSWTEVGDLNTARFVLAGAGTVTSALAFGGYDFNPNYTAKTESWNGTAWTEVGDLNTARYYISGTGPSNRDAIAFGGNSGSVTGATELWNGAAWTEQNDLNTARELMGDNGTTTSALGYGGNPPFLSLTEEWNGSSIATKVLTD